MPLPMTSRKVKVPLFSAICMVTLGTILLVNMTIANGIYPLKEDCQAPPQESGVKFKEGDLVSLKSGGPTMVVSGPWATGGGEVLKSPGGAPMLSCTWSDKEGRVFEKPFSESILGKLSESPSNPNDF